MVSVYRAMTPVERIEAGLAATDMIRDRLRATFRASHPDWTDLAIEQAVSQRMLGASD